MRIIKYPHPTLRHKSKPLRRVDSELKKTVREMFDSMYEQTGIGLAANQIDLPYRFFVMNIESNPEAEHQEFVFINPVIQKQSGSEEGEEGCLSLPEVYAPVRRSAKILISAYDLAGEEIHLELSGLFARAAQHEYDHLDGVLFIDRLGPSALASVKDELSELQSQFAAEQQRGMIPDDQQIAARLAELETLRT